MRISECMTRSVEVAAPSQSVVEAARLMADLDIGALPVSENDRLIGMVTDRDIVVRGVAAQQGELKSMKLADVMSSHVRCAHEGDDVDRVLSEMADAQIRRMPVVDQQQRLVGIVTLGDIAAKNPDDQEDVAMSLGDISTPAEPDRSETGNQSQSQSQSQGSSRH